MDLASLIVPSKETVAEYPSIDGFEVTLAYLTRDELNKIKKKATTNKVNKKTRDIEEEVNAELFQDIYINSVIKGWKGLTGEGLKTMIPVPDTVEDDEIVEYTDKNALVLMKNCSDFDSWVGDVLSDIQNFTQSN